MHQIVLFCGFLRAPNRAFLWFSSCTKSCFFVVFFVHQIVPQFMLFFLKDDFASYTKSCSSSSFFVVFFVHQIVLFSGFLRAPSRAFFWFSSCTKSCFFCAFFVHQTVLFFYFSSCTKSCFFLVFFVHQIVLFSAVFFVHQMVPYFVPLLQRLGKTQYIHTSLVHIPLRCKIRAVRLAAYPVDWAISRNIGVLQFWTFEKGSLLESSGRIQKNYHLVMTNIAMRFLAGKIIYFYGPWLPWLC